MKRLFQTVLAGAMFLVAAPANAAVVSFDFSADIGVVDAGLAAAGFNAPTITGTLTYDTVGVDASPNPNRGQYSTSTREFSFSNAVGDIAGSLTGGTIVIENDARDSFGFRTGIGFGLGTMGDVPGYQLRDIALFLEDQDGLTFSDIGLPAELDLADFTSERIFSFRYIEIATGDSVFAAGEITSLVPAPAAVIPLPASLPLLVAGLGFVFALRRRGQPLA